MSDLERYRMTVLSMPGWFAMSDVAEECQKVNSDSGKHYYRARNAVQYLRAMGKLEVRRVTGGAHGEKMYRVKEATCN